MKKKIIYMAALLAVTGVAAVFYTGSIKTGKDHFGIFTPASDEPEEEFLLKGTTDVLIVDEAVPLGDAPGTAEAGPGGGEGQQTGQKDIYVNQIANMVNGERTKAGLPPLEINDELCRAAAIRVNETTSEFSHTRPDGSAYKTVLEQSGIGYRGCGENIAYGYRTPEAVVSGWMNSEGHKANILSERYDSIGVGYCRDGSGVAYWVQLFMTKR